MAGTVDPRGFRGSLGALSPFRGQRVHEVLALPLIRGVECFQIKHAAMVTITTGASRKDGDLRPRRSA